MQTLERKALQESIVEKVKLRLLSFGYGIATTDAEAGEIITDEEITEESEETQQEAAESVTEDTEEEVYQFTAMELMAISFGADKCIHRMEMELNSDIPTAFEYALVDMVVGEFLMTQKSLGTLQMNAIDYSMAVKAIQEGDTNITFDNADSDSAKLQLLISYLMHPEIDYADYRKIRW